MGLFDRLRFANQYARAVERAEQSGGPAFSVDEDSIDPAVFGLTSYASPTSPAPRVDRRTAIQVPAVKRGRDLICGTLGGLPIDLIGPGQTPSVSSLFEQPERDVARSITMIRTFEDMLFEGRAWWKITEFGWHGYPVFVERLTRDRVQMDEQTKAVYVDGRQVEDSEVIRFDSPNDALLVAGARAVRTALGLDTAASNGAAGVPPVDYFTPVDDADPLEDDEITDVLTDWQTSRQDHRTAYVPAALKYNVAGWSPEQLQLADARQHAVLEISRVVGLDPEDLGVSITSRVYANAETRRRDLLDFTLSAYLIAVSDRLKMGDVTPRGYYAKFNLDAFLRSDTLQRYQAYEVGLRVGAVTKPEIRALEDRPPIDDQEDEAETPDASPLVALPSPQEDPMAASATPSITFDDEPAIRLDAPGTQAFEVDVEKRTVRGLLVPYGVPGSSNGKLWQFAKGTLTYAAVNRVKLWVQHDKSQAVGVAFELDDRDDGLYGAFKVARGADGDRVLSLAEDGVLDGFSIGLGQGGRFALRQGINHAITAPLMETSLTPSPSFDDARVHAVAASATHPGESMEPTAVVAEPGAETPTTEAGPGGADFSAITNAISQGFDGLRNPQVPPRETVGNAAAFQVDEELPYRFDGVRGANCFSDDLRAAFTQGDADARQRLETFLEAAFAVTTTNAGALNPSRHRPELYVPQLQYSTPLWDLVSTGTLEDQTPFIIPKFSSASGLVGDHTQGTEPTPGAFAATSQTVTPGPLSGKVEINREVWDQGGNPKADAIIWGEMLNAWAEAREAKIATQLAVPATAELNLASAEDAALVDALTGYFAGLQFVRGGNRFTAFAADGKLFPKLVAAEDSTGRKLLPVVGPQNAQGTVDGAFDRVTLGNQTIRAAWALGSAAASESYNFVPTSVWAWASTPKRFTFEYQVKSIDMAIWGYVATAVLRDSDVKPIDYDVADS